MALVAAGPACAGQVGTLAVSGTTIRDTPTNPTPHWYELPAVISGCDASLRSWLRQL